MTVTLHCEDVVRWAEGWKGEPFHALGDAFSPLNFSISFAVACFT
jgi:hypothetical protein